MQTAVKERPLLMRGVEVRAILEGRMSQFWRVMKPQPEGLGFWGYDHDDDDTPYVCFGSDMPGMVERIRCPYGPIGTRLYAKETLKIHHPSEAYYAADHVRVEQNGHRFVWRDVQNKWANGARTLPSVHLPRWASRLTLEVTGVRVMQIQGVTEADILAGGITVDRVAEWTNTPWSSMPTLHDAFMVLWDELNPKHPWSSDPWVRGVAFRRV